MDLNNLYPTYRSFAQGTSDEYTAEMTTHWGGEYEGETVNDMSSYWLGYIRKDNLPEQYKRGIIYFDSSANKVIVKDITNEANFPCTYGSFESYGSTLSRYTLAQSVDGVETITTNGNTRLYNQLYPEYIGVSYNGNSNYDYALHISFYYVLFDGGGNIVNTSYSNMYKLTETTGILFSTNSYGRNAVKEAYNFLFKNSEYTLTISGHDFTITANDLGTGTCYLSAEDGYSVRLFLCGYEVNSYAAISTSPSARPMGFIVKTQESHLNHSIETIAISNGADIFQSTEWWDLSGSAAGGAINDHTSEEDPLYSYYWGFDEEIDITEIQRVNEFNSSSTGYAYGYTDHLFLHRDNQSGYSAKCVLTPYYPISSVEKTFSLSIRVDVSGTYTPSYSEHFTYATDVSSSNEFLAKLKTGDITNTTFKNGLREWQYEDLQSDEFDEDDVPPYGPTPGPDDWDPDTTPDEDDNDYERTPTTQLHQPFLGALGQRWWAMTASEFNEIVSNVKSILTVWSLFAVNNAQDISESPSFAAHAKSAADAYSSGFVSNPVDCVAAVLWYPFDITLMLDAVSQTFVWGGSSATVFNGVLEDGAPDTGVRNCLEITGYLNNAYWLDGGFTDYFKHYKNFIDYHPYCTAELYVPYCGSVKIDPQQYVGHHLSVRYLIDFPTGACLALIYRDNLVVDTIAGQIGVSVAMSMPDYIEYSGRNMQAATNVKASKLQTLGTIWSTVGRALKGDIGAIGGATAIAAGFEADKLAEYQLDNTLINQKTISTASPAISTGNEQVCRLVLYQPRWLEGYGQNSYGSYGHTTGFATIKNEKLGSFTGLTVAESIDTSGIAQATEKEKAMIQNAFKGGVYL